MFACNQWRQPLFAGAPPYSYREFHTWDACHEHFHIDLRPQPMLDNISISSQCPQMLATISISTRDPAPNAGHRLVQICISNQQPLRRRRKVWVRRDSVLETSCRGFGESLKWIPGFQQVVLLGIELGPQGQLLTLWVQIQTTPTEYVVCILFWGGCTPILVLLCLASGWLYEFWIGCAVFFGPLGFPLSYRLRGQYGWEELWITRRAAIQTWRLHTRVSAK